MPEHLWQTATGPEPAILRPAILEAHEAVQLPASAAGALAEPRDDDSHRSLRWSAEHGALVGEPLGGVSDARVGVRLADLTLLVLDDDGDDPSRTLALAGRTRAEAYDWLAGVLGARADGAVELEPPEFEIPETPVGRGARWTGTEPGARRAVSALYGAAAGTLTRLARGRADASPVRCWPHHFDIATLLTLREGDEEEMRSVGVGMAPMGGGYDDWYLYVNVWPYPDAGSLPDLERGRWHTEGWVGAVLTANEVRAAQGGANATVDAFVAEAVAVGERLLAGTG